jgi:phosphoenolpyruvate carboxykinase (ATP)
VLENVVFDPVSPDVDDASLTENTRACYPLDHIPNASATGLAPHPANVIMLTCDAFGVMPPSTANGRAGDVPFPLGLHGACRRQGSWPRESTCFGAPFMPRRPAEYAAMLGDRIRRSGARCWLVNTGWSGSAYGTNGWQSVIPAASCARCSTAAWRR